MLNIKDMPLIIFIFFVGLIAACGILALLYALSSSLPFIGMVLDFGLELFKFILSPFI